MKPSRLKINQVCVQCKTPELLEVDHIIPLSQGGSNKRENLQILCRECHIKKTQLDEKKYGKPLILSPYRKKERKGQEIRKILGNKIIEEIKNQYRKPYIGKRCWGSLSKERQHETSKVRRKLHQTLGKFDISKHPQRISVIVKIMRKYIKNHCPFYYEERAIKK